jgi:hypothetical protein
MHHSRVNEIMQELRAHMALLDDAIAAMERLQAVQRGFGYSAADASGSTGPISRAQARRPRLDKPLLAG